MNNASPMKPRINSALTAGVIVVDTPWQGNLTVRNSTLLEFRRDDYTAGRDHYEYRIKTLAIPRGVRYNLDCLPKDSFTPALC